MIAANIDTVFICMSLNQDFNLRRLERYMTIAWDSGAMPVVVLTKADLCENPDAMVMKVSEVAAGADIVVTSSKMQDIEKLAGLIKSGKTYAFCYKASTGTPKDVLIAETLTSEPSDWSDGVWFTDAAGQTAAPSTFVKGNYYKKRYTNKNDVWAVKVIKVE